jgi:hypothetical protein
VVLDEFRYDAAGRVSMMRTPDAEIDIDSYDNEGHPLHVKETRLINGTPSSALEQTYTWNAHGERTSWTMPRLGTRKPDGPTPSSKITAQTCARIQEVHQRRGVDEVVNGQLGSIPALGSK